MKQANERSKFIQIAIETEDGDSFIYALDDRGIVWFREVTRSADFSKETWFPLSDVRNIPEK